MMKLKSLLLNRADRCDDLRVQHQNIQQWRTYWFQMRPRLKQAIFTWKQTGILSADDHKAVAGLLESFDEFWKALGNQANRLIGGESGPRRLR